MAIELKSTDHSYSPVDASFSQKEHQQQSPDIVAKVSWWQLLERATRSVYGPRITVIHAPISDIELEYFIADLNFTVLHSDSQPRRTRPTIIDIAVKQYVNRSEKETGETLVKVEKLSSVTSGRRYYFSTSQGVSFQEYIGSKIVGLSASGGSMRVGDGKTKTSLHSTSLNDGMKFDYKHEESLTIPPGTKTTATITTYTVKYEQKYTLEFSIASNRSVPVMIKRPRCIKDLLCCCCPCCECTRTVRVFVSAVDILKGLPGYRVSGGKTYFTQEGKLTWIGEDCRVEKVDEDLN